MEKTATLSIAVTDVSEQKNRVVENVPPDATIAELRDSLLEELNLPRTDADGEPIHYQVFSSRASRHLGSTELVGECVEELDTLRLQPEINAAASLWG